MPTPEGQFREKEITMNTYDVLIEAIAAVYVIVTVDEENEERAVIAAITGCKELPLTDWELACPIPAEDPVGEVEEPLVLGVSCAETGPYDPLERKAYQAWLRYCTSGQKPDDIPSRPDIVYRDQGWTSWCAWLGWTKNGKPLGNGSVV